MAYMSTISEVALKVGTGRNSRLGGNATVYIAKVSDCSLYSEAAPDVGYVIGIF